MTPFDSTRRLWIVLAAFGLIVLVNFALFGWLIFRSLSEREIEKVLFETRREAEEIAGQIAERAEASDADLYTVLAVERETRTYLDSVLSDIDTVLLIEVRDAEGMLVYRDEVERSRPAAPGEQRLEIEEIPGELGPLENGEDRTIDAPFEYKVEEPIGDVGTLQIGIDPASLRQRIGELQQDLVRQAGIIFSVTALLLVAAYGLIWWLMRRSRRLEEQAAEAERMAYIGTLASGLAHEIRNPLNSLNLNMQMLEEEIAEVGGLPTGGRIFAITKDEIGRLERLVTDFLSYARPRPLDLETVRLVDLLEEAGEVLVPEARARRVGLEVEDRSGGATAAVDPAQMRQLILNLGQNALAAVSDPPPPPGRPGRVVLAVERRGGRVELLVEDDGPGIEAGRLEKIFDIFYSTRKGGTGLGLAIVQRIAKSHEGTVTVESTPGEGTVFRVSLPEPVAEDVEERPRPGRAERAAG